MRNPALTPPLSALLLILALPVRGWSQAPPGTDIWVFSLHEEGDEVTVTEGFRATRRPGYDNQPHFLPGGRSLLFTSIDGSGQADILRYHMEDGSLHPFTETTSESEYSATLMPPGNRVSVIRVEEDSTQRLWSFGLAGQDPAVVLPDIAPVGYHTWIDEDELALFVLGDPATLQLARKGPGEGRVKASDIGRSLHAIPNRRAVSFVQWKEDGRGVISELEVDTGEVRALAPVLEGNEFHAWTPGGILLSGQGSALFRWAEGEGWREITDLSALGLGGISRLAVSPEGDRIAVVGVGG